MRRLSQSIFIIITIIFFNILFFGFFSTGYAIKKYAPTIKVNVPEYASPYSDVEIIAYVTDKFGEINSTNATLSFSTNNSAYWNSTKMELVYGTLSNGTFSGVIPGQKENTTVQYRLRFNDNLNYSGLYEGNYTVTSRQPSREKEEAVLDNNPPIVQEVHVGQNTPYDNAVLKAIIYDEENNINDKNVTLKYTYGEHSENKTADIKLSNKDLDEYTGYIPPFKENTLVKWYLIAYDNAGNKIETKGNYTVQRIIFLHNIMINITISELNSKDLTSKPEISAVAENLTRDDLISQKSVWMNADVNNIGNIRMFQFNVIPEPVNNSSKMVTLKLLPPSNVPIPSIKLAGSSSNFPFDRYELNLILAIPIKNVNIQRPSPLFSDLVNASWQGEPKQLLQINYDNSSVQNLCTKKFDFKRVICDTGGKEMSFANMKLEFKRNYTYLAIALPMVGIFFLLGAIFIFENPVEDIGSRLALTLGVFALIFTLPQLIDSMKPQTSVPTIADSLLSIIIIATILFTISSVISISTVARKFQRVWPWIDVAVFISVSLVVVFYFFGGAFSTEVTSWLVPTVIVGLGYGFILRIFKIRKSD